MVKKNKLTYRKCSDKSKNKGPPGKSSSNGKYVLAKDPKARARQNAAIRQYYADKREDELNISTKRTSRVGNVYRGITKYIDPETKLERNYVVVRDNGRSVAVSKLKSIKQFDDNGKNTDPALFEINYKKYGLLKRTGVDFQRFDKNRMSSRPLELSDKRVFPEEKERFKLSSHDTHKVIKHTEKKKKPRQI